MKGGVFWYVGAVSAELASAILRALEEAGLDPSHPVLDRPSYLSNEPGHEGDAIASDLLELGRRVSDACRGRGAISFQLWVDQEASHDVICTATTGRSGLACLEFSFDGLDIEEAHRVENAVATVRQRAEVVSKVLIADYVGIDPPHISPLVL